MLTIPLAAAALLGAAQTTTPQTGMPQTGMAQTGMAQTGTQTAPAGTAATTGTATIKPTVGAAVSDQAGAPVGTITQINGAVAVIDTGTSKAGVPLTAIGPGPNGGLITTVTKAQLDAAATQGAAQLKQMLVPGASVRGRNESAVVGTVKAVDDQFVTLTTPKGDVRFPATAFAVRPSGLIVSMTAEQFDAAVAQSLAATAK